MENFLDPDTAYAVGLYSALIINCGLINPPVTQGNSAGDRGLD